MLAALAKQAADEVLRAGKGKKPSFPANPQHQHYCTTHWQLKQALRAAKLESMNRQRKRRKGWHHSIEARRQGHPLSSEEHETTYGR